MPIPELTKFRQQYPMYNDMDDLTLATKLAEKYPVYSDLIDKVKTEQSQPQFAGQPKPSLYSEVVSPILAGGSTFAAGIPRLVAKAQGPGMEQAVFPEQQTFGGKALRGVSEIAGFTAGLPGQAAKFAGRGIGKVAEKIIPKFVGKALLSRIAQGAGAGAAGMAVAGSDLKDRKEKAITGGIIGGGAAVISPAISKGFQMLGRGLTALSGIEKEVYQEASRKGFRNVLKSKFYGKKLPSEIQNRIADNIDNMHLEAGQEYEKLTAPLKQVPFDMPQFKGDVIKAANRVKLNPFDTDVSKVDNAILDGVVNKAQVKNLGDALDLRRNLDDIIYSNKGELKTSFGKQVRDLLNKTLHQNKDLAAVDKDWTDLQEILKEGRKVLSDTGEKILERFGNLTEKQKQLLAGLEKKIGGVPFIEDLTNYSLAKEFITRKIGASPTGMIRAAIKPVTRGFLRQGEKFTGGLKKIDERTIGRLLGK